MDSLNNTGRTDEQDFNPEAIDAEDVGTKADDVVEVGTEKDRLRSEKRDREYLHQVVHGQIEATSARVKAATELLEDADLAGEF